MISIEINPETTIQQLQKIFSKEFPLLKIEFFNAPHQSKQGSPKSEMIEDSSIKVIALNSLGMDKVIAVHPNMPVGEFETLFENKLGLHVQVFAKSGSAWLETIQSDELSLLQLNDNTKERNTKIVQAEEMGDYHEQE